jgi:hypothetical protein
MKAEGTLRVQTVHFTIVSANQFNLAVIVHEVSLTVFCGKSADCFESIVAKLLTGVKGGLVCEEKYIY